MVINNLDAKSIAQYQAEERTMMTFRLVLAKYQVKELFDIMCKDKISQPEKIEQLKKELSSKRQTPKWAKPNVDAGTKKKKKIKK